MKTHPAVLIVASVIGVALLVGIGFFGYKSTRDRAAHKEISAATDHLLQANAEDASATVDALLRTLDPSMSAYATAKKVQLLSDFHAQAFNTVSPATSADWIAMVQAGKHTFATVQTDRDRAAAIFMMMVVLEDSRDEGARAEVFTDEPFAAFATSSLRTAMTSVLKYSLQLYPLPETYALLARLQSGAISFALQPGTSIPFESSRENQENLASRARLILTYVNAADTLVKSQGSADTAFARYLSVWTDYWKAFALGGAARVDKKYLHDAETLFQKVITTSEDVRDASGATHEAFMQLQAEARLAYARTLLQVAGSARAEDIRVQLSTFIGMLNANPDIYAAEYRLFNESRDAVAAVAPGMVSDQRMHIEFVALAKISPEFKMFLEHNGWKF